MTTTAQLDACPYFPYDPDTMLFPFDLRLLPRGARHCDLIAIALDCLREEKILKTYHTDAEEEPYQDTACADFIAIYDNRGIPRKRRQSEGPTVAIPNTNNAIAMTRNHCYTGSTMYSDGHGVQIAANKKKTITPLLIKGKQTLTDLLADPDLKKQLYNSIFGKPKIDRRDFDVTYVEPEELPAETAERSNDVLKVPEALIKKKRKVKPEAVTPVSKKPKVKGTAAPKESPQDRKVKEQASKIAELERTLAKAQTLRVKDARSAMRDTVATALNSYANVVGKDYESLSEDVDKAVQMAKAELGLQPPPSVQLSSSDSDSDSDSDIPASR